MKAILLNLWWRISRKPVGAVYEEPLTYCVGSFRRHYYKGREFCARCGATSGRKR